MDDEFSAESGALNTLLSCNFNSYFGRASDCDVKTNGPFVTNAPFAIGEIIIMMIIIMMIVITLFIVITFNFIGSHTEVVLRAGQQARLTFKKQIPSENPICVVVHYDIGPAEFGKTSLGKRFRFRRNGLMISPRGHPMQPLSMIGVFLIQVKCC